MSQSPAAAPIIRDLSAGQEFARLVDAFRARLDREVAAFLEAKRAAGQAAASPGAAADPAALSVPAAWPQGAGAGAPMLAAEPADLVEGVARLIAQGGKRLRPALVYYTYRACGGRSEEQVLPLALATELLHTYLLIHDDIMDHAELRRGQPAAHARFRDLHRAAGLRGDGEDFGRSVAILLGDLAHTYAVELFTTAAGAPPSSHVTPADLAPRRQWADLNRCFSAMCEEVIAGQYLELLLAHRPWETATAAAAAAGEASRAAREAQLLRILRLKSGRYTAERPIQLGALLAGASPELRAELSRYGAAVGEAFQLQDDLLGVFGDPATVGKPVGDDLREGKFTFLVHHALAAGGPGDRQLLAAALGKPDLSGDEVASVQQVIERTGARRAVTAMVAERLNAARRALEAVRALSAAQPAPAAGEGLLFLSGLHDDVWDRKQ